jgi:hypothetical protein
MGYERYYVYTLAYPDGRIFYVGKGKGDRINHHEQEARKALSGSGEVSAKVQVIREIWRAGGKVVKTKVFETESEQGANDYERQLIAQCDPQYLTNQTKGGGPLFSSRDPYARLKYRELFYSPQEAGERLGVSPQVWHRLFLAGVLHFYQAEGCTLPVLDRREIDLLAAKIKDGSYPIDAWEMDAPNVWKANPPEKRSLWWDDEPLPQQEEEQPHLSKIEMQREAATTALNAAQQASSEPCFLIGSYEQENDQTERDEPAWKVLIKVGQKQYTYLVKLQQDQFVIGNAPLRPPRSEKREEPLALPEGVENPQTDTIYPSRDQDLLEDNGSQPSRIPASHLYAAESATPSSVPRLTVEQVKEKWEYVLRRIKSTKKDGPKIAALLRGYDIVDVDESADLPIVVLKARSHFHYHAIQKGEYQPSIEWALKIELEQECRLRLLVWTP